MRRTVVFAGALLLSGCATDTQFLKQGSSAAAQKRDSNCCWSQAQATNVPPEAQTAAVVGGLIGGGLAGALGAAIGNSIVENDPKNGYRRQAHDACMTKRGYKVAS